MAQPGALVISLDFELHWGLRDITGVDGYRENLLGVREAIPAMLERFGAHRVHATWATVGFLFAQGREDLIAHLPELRPTYGDARLSPYGDIDGLGRDESEDPFHFARSLLDAIAATPDQEIASHTFSHYYCLERGQTLAQFRADLLAARSIGAEFGAVIGSLVLPRNQWNPAYASVLAELGVQAYRVNRDHWCHRARRAGAEGLGVRGARFADSYLPVSGRTSSRWPVGGAPISLEASLFLRPYDPKTRAADRLKRRRILREITRAAEEGRIFHLWWHPHNFGRHTERNLEQLDLILRHFDRLRDSHGMESLTMAEVGARAISHPGRQTVSESQ